MLNVECGVWSSGYELVEGDGILCRLPNMLKVVSRLDDFDDSVGPSQKAHEGEWPSERSKTSLLSRIEGAL